MVKKGNHPMLNRAHLPMRNTSVIGEPSASPSVLIDRSMKRGSGRYPRAFRHTPGCLLESEQSSSDGIDNCIGYGFLGIRGCRNVGCLDLEANIEGSYDSDKSWRALGELTLTYTY